MATRMNFPSNDEETNPIIIGIAMLFYIVVFFFGGILAWLTVEKVFEFVEIVWNGSTVLFVWLCICVIAGIYLGSKYVVSDNAINR